MGIKDFIKFPVAFNETDLGIHDADGDCIIRHDWVNGNPEGTNVVGHFFADAINQKERADALEGFFEWLKDELRFNENSSDLSHDFVSNAKNRIKEIESK